MRPSTNFDVHPKDHQASSLPNKTFDVVAIGSGWAGRVACARLTKAGLSTLLIEDELVGGDCPFWACVPSKVLLRPQEVLSETRSLSGTKELLHNGTGKVDVKATFARRDFFTGGFNDGPLLVPMVESAGVTIARGVGSLIGEKKVRITPNDGSATLDLEARTAVILATGSVPFYPPIKGLKEVNPWTPRDATSSSVVPDHLIVLGAGAVGTEMATAYNSFGGKVTLVSSADEIVPGIDTEAGRVVREALTKAGVKVVLGQRAVAASRNGAKVTIELSSGVTIEGSEILLATGRQPSSSSLNLAALDIKTDRRGNIPVNEHLQVPGFSWLYAGGDVTGRALLTHNSKYHGRVIGNAILAKDPSDKDWSSTTATADRLAVPQVIFSNPQVGSVGLTRKSAAKAGIKVREITAPYVTLGAKIASDDATEGWAQWLVDENNKLVGATLVGDGAGEQIHASTMAVVGGLTLKQMFHAIPCFPSVSEVYLNLLEAAGL